MPWCNANYYKKQTYVNVRFFCLVCWCQKFKSNNGFQLGRDGVRIPSFSVCGEFDDTFIRYRTVRSNDSRSKIGDITVHKRARDITYVRLMWDGHWQAIGNTEKS
jgi:hypothetical protein